eukprot:XP_001695357.1 RWP-RK transcription factor [Chlamydomonas reinhardtii]
MGVVHEIPYCIGNGRVARHMHAAHEDHSRLWPYLTWEREYHAPHLPWVGTRAMLTFVNEDKLKLRSGEIPLYQLTVPAALSRGEAMLDTFDSLVAGLPMLLDTDDGPSLEDLLTGASSAPQLRTRQEAAEKESRVCSGAATPPAAAIAAPSEALGSHVPGGESNAAAFSRGQGLRLQQQQAAGPAAGIAGGAAATACGLGAALDAASSRMRIVSSSSQALFHSTASPAVCLDRSASSTASAGAAAPAAPAPPVTPAAAAIARLMSYTQPPPPAPAHAAGPVRIAAGSSRAALLLSPRAVAEMPARAEVSALKANGAGFQHAYPGGGGFGGGSALATASSWHASCSAMFLEQQQQQQLQQSSLPQLPAAGFGDGELSHRRLLPLTAANPLGGNSKRRHDGGGGFLLPGPGQRRGAAVDGMDDFLDDWGAGPAGCWGAPLIMPPPALCAPPLLPNDHGGNDGGKGAAGGSGSQISSLRSAWSTGVLLRQQGSAPAHVVSSSSLQQPHGSPAPPVAAAALHVHQQHDWQQRLIAVSPAAVAAAEAAGGDAASSSGHGSGLGNSAEAGPMRALVVAPLPHDFAATCLLGQQGMGSAADDAGGACWVRGSSSRVPLDSSSGKATYEPSAGAAAALSAAVAALPPAAAGGAAPRGIERQLDRPAPLGPQQQQAAQQQGADACCGRRGHLMELRGIGASGTYACGLEDHVMPLELQQQQRHLQQQLPRPINSTDVEKLVPPADGCEGAAAVRRAEERLQLLSSGGGLRVLHGSTSSGRVPSEYLKPAAAAEKQGDGDSRALPTKARDAAASAVDAGLPRKKRPGAGDKAAQLLARAKAQAAAVDWPLPLPAEAKRSGRSTGAPRVKEEDEDGEWMGDEGPLVAVALLGEHPLQQEPTLEQLKRYYEQPIKAAARALGISLTCFKGVCRRLGVPRWPGRKLQTLKKMRDTLLQAGVGGAVTIECAGGAVISPAEQTDLIAKIALNISDIYADACTPMYPEFTRVRQLQYKTRSVARQGRRGGASGGGGAGRKGAEGSDSSDGEGTVTRRTTGGAGVGKRGGGVVKRRRRFSERYSVSSDEEASEASEEPDAGEVPQED